MSTEALGASKGPRGSCRARLAESRLLLSKRLRDALPHEAVKASFIESEGQALHLPEDAIPPDGEFLKVHRERFAAA